MQQVVIVFIAFTNVALSQHNPNFFPNRSTIVHLFEWKFNDIANECETYLSSHGFAGVQVMLKYLTKVIEFKLKSDIVIYRCHQSMKMQSFGKDPGSKDIRFDSVFFFYYFILLMKLT